ncbi:hypothetical protein LC55x_2717 [Lysobacter capsici]|uniref:hypothetical protein n=1 Tax=Lysobacter capsici TaxID=435897 RepID=UPI0007164528|nr:hypothetical protein [Lysobacter capsici]ALN85982.1 hypothetical protein LC55x_2717 [Lysobacter capsici]
MNFNAPIVTVLGDIETRMVNIKGNTKQVHFQLASCETAQMRIQIDLEHDDPAKAYKVGEKFAWDLTADLVPGQYGRPELSRRKTLRPIDGKPATAAPKAS